MEKSPDNDDYELMPQHELDALRREVSGLKRNSLMEGDKGRVLIDSIDRLTLSINRLITILDDAQKDIIDEYQDSKPVEKLNALIEQNQTIAKALVVVTDSLGSARTPQMQQPMQRENVSVISRQVPPVQPMQPPSAFQQPMNPPPIQGFDLPPLDQMPPLEEPPKKKFLGIM
jgi:hypothetical protein